jgi:hypothetical protein
LQNEVFSTMQSAHNGNNNLEFEKISHALAEVSLTLALALQRSGTSQEACVCP